MAELKEALILTNDKSTLLKEVEGQLTVEHQYIGEATYTMVVDEAIRGDYRTANGMFPAALSMWPGLKIKECIPHLRHAHGSK